MSITPRHVYVPQQSATPVVNQKNHRALKSGFLTMTLIERRTTIGVATDDPAPLLKEKPDRRNIHHRDALSRRLHSEFQKTPGLSLTPVEASRLFGIASDVCQRVLCALVEDGLLDLRTDGRYVDRPSSL